MVLGAEPEWIVEQSIKERLVARVPQDEPRAAVRAFYGNGEDLTRCHLAQPLDPDKLDAIGTEPEREAERCVSSEVVNGVGAGHRGHTFSGNEQAEDQESNVPDAKEAADSIHVDRSTTDRIVDRTIDGTFPSGGRKSLRLQTKVLRDHLRSRSKNVLIKSSVSLKPAPKDVTSIVFAWTVARSQLR